MVRPIRSKSHKRPDLPNVRPCEVCKEDRPIVSHGCCDRCRKKQDRRDNKIAFSPVTAVHPATGHKNLSILFRLMHDCKVSNAARRGMLELFLPFTGLPLIVQEAELDALRNSEPGYQDDTGWSVHSGSSRAPAESLVRTPDLTDSKVGG
jgi:hypothetical protein